jgi:hypothetical protein
MTDRSIPLIHIGYPKAVSSWMQKWLFKPENGFCKVLDSLTLQLFLIDATPFTFDTTRANERITKILRETPNSEQLQQVITGESLVGHTHCGGYNAKTNADRLKELCPQAKILIIVREQKATIRSLYKTFVIWGMPHSIDRILDPVEPNLSPQFNLDFLRYDLLVQYYQQLYGRENVLVLPYESFTENGASFLHRIFSFCNIDNIEAKIKKLPVKRKVNRGQTLFNLLVERQRNLFFVSSPFNYAGWFKPTEESLKHRIARSKKNPFPAFMDNWFEAGFRQKVEAHCTGQFSESNRKLQELTGLDLTHYGYEL